MKLKQFINRLKDKELNLKFPWQPDVYDCWMLIHKWVFHKTGKMLEGFESVYVTQYVYSRYVKDLDKCKSVFCPILDQEFDRISINERREGDIVLYREETNGTNGFGIVDQKYTFITMSNRGLIHLGIGMAQQGWRLKK